MTGLIIACTDVNCESYSVLYYLNISGDDFYSPPQVLVYQMEKTMPSSR